MLFENKVLRRILGYTPSTFIRTLSFVLTLYENDLTTAERRNLY